MKKLTFLLVILLVIISSCNIKDNYQETLEQAYFEGQRDALNGDIRIKKDLNGCYIWTKSPWNDERAPIFDPSFNCDNNLEL